MNTFHGNPRSLKTEWRCIAGLGRKGPLEVGFTFNRYGFPILPGSSLKGIARAYAHLVDERDESDPKFLTIFGRAPQKGEDETIAQGGRRCFLRRHPGRVAHVGTRYHEPALSDYYQGNGTPPTGKAHFLCRSWQLPQILSFVSPSDGEEYGMMLHRHYESRPKHG